MKIDAIKGDSLSHSALRARSYANTYFNAMAKHAVLVMAVGVTAPAIPPARFNYFGIEVEITEAMTPQAIEDAILQQVSRRFMQYRRGLVPGAGLKTFEGTPGLNVLESAWAATQSAQEEVNAQVDQGAARADSRYGFEFNGVVVEFNPYTNGGDVAQAAMDAFGAKQLAFENSPEGQAAFAKQDRRLQDAKVKLDGYVAGLDSVLSKSLKDVLLWIENYARAYNVNQRDAQVGKVIRAFEAKDFVANVYVGESSAFFDIRGKEPLGRYIVGQFMATLKVGRDMPSALEVLLAQYRAKA